MPEVLQDGLPDRSASSRFDFAPWADGQAWKFIKGQDYDSRTDTFRTNVKRWAKVNGFTATCRPYPALDHNGKPIPLSRADPIALGVKFERAAARAAAPAPGAARAEGRS